MAEFLKIKSLLDGKAPTVLARSDEPIGTAMERMKRFDYSQLPVIDDRGSCLGLLTSESIVHKLLEIGDHTKLLDPPAKSCCVDAHFVKPDDDLFDFLDPMANKTAVLVREGSKIAGIVTNYDVLKLFRRIAEAFLILRDIEMSLRDIVSKHHVQVHPETLSFEELRGLIVSNWEDFESVFQGSREAVAKKLETVRDIRNNVCHFRGSLTADELDQLRESRRWLDRLG